ncbi:MAG TPA: HAD family phosphatase [Thermoanaerobaculia bacterium]|nr:HAD family phosphatase [Thermoanaerobaculia bacterium]
MPDHSWFLFDLGNVLIDLAFDRVVTRVCRESDLTSVEMVSLLEGPGGYRDLERGAVDFRGLHMLLRERAGYRATLEEFRSVWADFFAGITPGMEDLLETIRSRYIVAFLSNSNEVHAEVIPQMFPSLFREGEVMIFSHEHGCSKPDPEMFRKALDVLGAEASKCLYVDDIEANVEAARNAGMTAFHFRGAAALRQELRERGFI